MKSSKADVEKQLHDAHGDQNKKEERKIPDNLHEYKEPFVEFNDSPPSWGEFNKQLRKTRSKSAPGPNWGAIHRLQTMSRTCKTALLILERHVEE